MRSFVSQKKIQVLFNGAAAEIDRWFDCSIFCISDKLFLFSIFSHLHQQVAAALMPESISHSLTCFSSSSAAYLAICAMIKSAHG